MKKFYKLCVTVLIFYAVVFRAGFAQECGGLRATCKPYESRCAATGSIKVNAIGGSGNYKYKVTGTVNTNFTSTDSITGLPAGTYTVVLNDISTNCAVQYRNVVVPGTYQDPRFTLNSTNVTCDNGSNGSISLNTQLFGRAPFSYSIVAPSPMGIGTSNNTGTFTDLVAGLYTIQMRDSCGGIQTRLVTINNYTWRLDPYPFTKISCDSAAGFIRVIDSRGNISTSGGIPGFLYGIIRGAGDTIWSSNATFTFSLAGKSNFEVVAKDACGKMKKAPLNVSFRPSVGNTVNIFAQSCNSFSASLTSITNFFGRRFCISDSSGTELECNSTGVFHLLPYGNYCINAYDSCADTLIVRCFSAVPPPIRVDQFPLISDKDCSNFTATITGQVGLTLPVYCLYDSAGNQLYCNTTGSFTGLLYGDYCITIRDSCRDTTLIRCFNARKPGPVIPDVLLPGYLNCTNFGLHIVGDSLFNPRFCIFDSSGTELACNSTGIFDSLLYGNYCINIYDSCYDTTIVRCIGILGPEVINNITAVTSSKACNTFSVNVYGTNLINPYYCLYNAADSLIGCDSSGAFDNVPYGAYYVKANNSCPDTILTYHFAEYPALPFMNSNVNITGKDCSSFTVSTSGEQNITNAQYCLYNQADSLLTCNTTGAFTGLLFGQYCIRIADGCYDTTIVRCFTVTPDPVSLNVTARKSCTNGFARISISASGGVMPATISVFSPGGNLYYTGTYSSGTINIDSMDATGMNEFYKVALVDQCGNTDTVSVVAESNIFTHSPMVFPKCPSSTWSNGSGSITGTANSNTGTVSYRIIKKDNTFYSPYLMPSSIAGPVATFNNLGPGTYIVRYRVNDGCGKLYYDTVTINPYAYPNLDRSSAYQCDHNGFSIGAVVSNGVGPFTYEIIGSTPAAPSIVTAPQLDPVFPINNGTTYSLVRLRALDVCGNATLEDASILPLANNGITADFNCFQLFSNLSVDTLYNSTYTWYRKHTELDVDSTFLGSGGSYFVPNLTPDDTGLYVCHMVVNSGCISRTYYYRLTGACTGYLPVTVKHFEGRFEGQDVLLNWQLATNENLKQVIIERKDRNGLFREIGRVLMPPGTTAENYSLKDVLPPDGKNYYRLKIIQYNNTTHFSNVVMLQKKQQEKEVTVYPNPVTDQLVVQVAAGNNSRYQVKVLNQLSQVVKDLRFDGSNAGNLLIRRTKEMGAGVYVVQILNLNTNVVFTQKLVFQPLN